MPSDAPTSADAAAPAERPIARTLAGALVAVALFWFLSLFDRVVFAHALDPDAKRLLYVRALKWLGTIWPWLIAAAALIAIDARAARKSADPADDTLAFIARRGGMLFSSAALAGLLAEILKPVLRRERPIYHEGLHAFRPLADRPLYGGGLDLPSSHAATAFGAAFALCALFPKLTPLWLLLAAACAWTRVIDGAHFLSGVFLAAAIALASTSAITRIARAQPAC